MIPCSIKCYETLGVSKCVKIQYVANLFSPTLKGFPCAMCTKFLPGQKQQQLFRLKFHANQQPLKLSRAVKETNHRGFEWREIYLLRKIKRKMQI